METSSLSKVTSSFDGATWLDKGFYNILIDTVTLCAHASQSQEESLERSLTRSVILHSGILIESAANVLVWGFFSSPTASDIDKLSPLAKIDVYLECKGKERLDRGSTVVQRAAELKKLRDGLVHPKFSKRELRADDLSLGTYKAERPSTSHVRIPDDSNLWKYRHAKDALSAAVEFLRFLFDRIHLGDRASVLQILASEIQGEGIERSTIFRVELKKTRELAATFNINIDFMLPDDDQLQ